MPFDMQTLPQLALESGASAAALVEISQVPFSPALRRTCEQNVCGNYNKNWMCPPRVGRVEDLMDRAKAFGRGLVFQTIGRLEDSFDFEGMEAAMAAHRDITYRIMERAGAVLPGEPLMLSAGGCTFCERCALADDEPCRNPDKAVSSVEAYGIFVAKLAELCGMNYINGANTVTYFGMLLFD